MAAGRSGLTKVPCWVRDLDDADAEMLLVTSNAQSDLTALEHGLHALRVTEKGSKLGKSINAYAKAVGRPQQIVQREVDAAEVYRAVSAFALTAPTDQPRHLAEIHAAPHGYGRRWCKQWPALRRPRPPKKSSPGPLSLATAAGSLAGQREGLAAVVAQNYRKIRFA